MNPFAKLFFLVAFVLQGCSSTLGLSGTNEKGNGRYFQALFAGVVLIEMDVHSPNGCAEIAREIGHSMTSKGYNVRCAEASRSLELPFSHVIRVRQLDLSFTRSFRTEALCQQVFDETAKASEIEMAERCRSTRPAITLSLEKGESAKAMQTGGKRFLVESVNGTLQFQIELPSEQFCANFLDLIIRGAAKTSELKCISVAQDASLPWIAEVEESTFGVTRARYISEAVCNTKLKTSRSVRQACTLNALR
jgi:uncharacterized protein YceK